MLRNNRKDMPAKLPASARVIVLAEDPKLEQAGRALAERLSLPFVSDLDAGRNLAEQLSVPFVSDPDAGRNLAEQLSVPFPSEPAAGKRPEQAPLTLHLTDEGLALEGGGLRLLPDLTDLRRRVAGGRLGQEFLAKVSKIKVPPEQAQRSLYAIDATAGLGEDSFILAAAGYHVFLFERDPVIAALLEDSLRRAKEDPVLGEIAGRMQVMHHDSIQVLRALAGRIAQEGPAGAGRIAQEDLAGAGRIAQEGPAGAGRIAQEDLAGAGRIAQKDPAQARQMGQEAPAGNGDDLQADRIEEDNLPVPDLIYLDPMFPQRRKSGLIGKKLQLLQKLEQPCSAQEEADLLDAAMAVHPRRIVIKRPLKGPYLNGKKPHYSLEGKAIRYDCFVFVSQQEP